ncbi:unnamed protein product [Porites lobata]|uniref:DDE Tnp4 domain-containing protein n=1 Tax=Porites lobata TaxID=104759 RepID=A0ABN8NGW6_9CNID|nr:unnamed protein product [Porites lobata]
MDEFIKFPTGLKAQAVMEAFEEKKGFFSVQLQVICDPDLFITDVFCGYPGSVHDARVFRNSPICREVEVNPDNYFPGNSHILGDAAYPFEEVAVDPISRQRTFDCSTKTLQYCPQFHQNGG